MVVRCFHALYKPIHYDRVVHSSPTQPLGQGYFIDTILTSSTPQTVSTAHTQNTKACNNHDDVRPGIWPPLRRNRSTRLYMPENTQKYIQLRFNRSRKLWLDLFCAAFLCLTYWSQLEKSKWALWEYDYTDRKLVGNSSAGALRIIMSCRRMSRAEALLLSRRAQTHICVATSMT